MLRNVGHQSAVVFLVCYFWCYHLLFGAYLGVCLVISRLLQIIFGATYAFLHCCGHVATLCVHLLLLPIAVFCCSYCCCLMVWIISLSLGLASLELSASAVIGVGLGFMDASLGSMDAIWCF